MCFWDSQVMKSSSHSSSLHHYLPYNNIQSIYLPATACSFALSLFLLPTVATVNSGWKDQVPVVKIVSMRLILLLLMGKLHTYSFLLPRRQHHYNPNFIIAT